MSFFHLLLAVRKKQPTVVKHSHFYLKLNSALFLALLSSSLGWLVLPSLATPLAGTPVDNQATGSYVDTLNSESVTAESNIVTIVVGEVAGISISPNSFSGNVSAGNTVYFSYVITNIGNDATQFYIPENAKVTGSGVQNGNIQITGYNLNGSTPVSLAASAYVDVAAGIATGDAGALAANGIIQPGGSVTVRVPVKVNTTASVNDSVTVLLGDTPEIAASTTTPKEHLQNQAYVDENTDQKYDVYTVDNPGGTIGEFNNVPPLNGDGVNHRQEASAAQKATVIGVDYGDAPDTGAGNGPGNYKTTLSDGGPSHVIVTGLSIGTKVDSDSSILQNVTADADNTNGTPNDEDGVVGLPVLKTIPGQTYTVQVKVTNTTGQPAYLVGYIDFNQNGDFGDVEDKSVTITVPSGATVGTYNVQHLVEKWKTMHCQLLALPR
jgi:GEVED domain